MKLFLVSKADTVTLFNLGLVRYSNGRLVTGCQIVRFLNGGLKTGPKMHFLMVKIVQFLNDLPNHVIKPFENWT